MLIEDRVGPVPPPPPPPPPEDWDPLLLQPIKPATLNSEKTSTTARNRILISPVSLRSTSTSPAPVSHRSDWTRRPLAHESNTQLNYHPDGDLCLCFVPFTNSRRSFHCAKGCTSSTKVPSSGASASWLNFHRFTLAQSAGHTPTPAIEQLMSVSALRTPVLSVRKSGWLRMGIRSCPCGILS